MTPPERGKSGNVAAEREYPIVPVRWANEQGTDEWHIEIEHDRFSDDEPFVVSLWMEGESDGETWDALATPTPQQAREMATALLVYAHLAEKANARSAAA